MKKLNFGCGKDIRKGWVNVDSQKAKGIDFSFDFLKDKYPFKDSEFDYVLIDNVLEHLPNPQEIMKKLWRICKNEAIIEAVVPYYNSYHAYSCPTHVNYFNEDALENTFRFRPYEFNSGKEKELFEILEIQSVPQRFLKWMPISLLNVLKRILGNIIVELRVKARVLK
jgi:ubiquinone/menaquinone biosynthesis C-methylase UbiE